MVTASHVVVVAPDSRRLRVSVVPTTTFGEIVKQAVGSWCLEGDAFRLRYKRTLLESSAQIRFSLASNMQPGVVLDLVKADCAPNRSIRVALQLPLGGRLSGEFGSNVYMADVLKAFAQHASFTITLNSANSTVIQIPELLVSGRRYGIEEWKALRVGDVADQTGLLVRVFWRDCRYSLEEIEQMLSGGEVAGNVTGDVGEDSAPVDRSQSTSPVSPEQTHQSIPRQTHQSIPRQTHQSTFQREFRIVDPSPTTRPPPTADSFELTTVQLKQMAEDARRRIKQVEDAPLVSKRAVDAKRRADLLSQYPHTIIRLKLPDKRVVEAQFGATELGAAVYSFAVQFAANTDCLVSAGKPVKRDVALVDQGLVPNAVVWAVIE